MGARGPRPDPDQAAKGNPGRRPAKARKAKAEAAKLAQLLAPVGSAAPQVDLPPMLQDPKYLPAAVVYRRLAPELRRTHRLPLESEFFFVQCCIYAQEWVSATEDLHLNGFSQDVETVAGGKMERRRPKNFDRQQAFHNLMELSGRFGLTPNDLYQLFKGQAAVAVVRPDLFGDHRSAGAPPAPTEDASPGRIGGLNRLRSAPPGERPN